MASFHFFKGFLRKKAAALGRDRVRFFELFGRTLTYYEAEGGREIGTVDMTHGAVSEKGEQSLLLKGPHMRREYQLTAKTTEERDEWFAALTHAAAMSQRSGAPESPIRQWVTWEELGEHHVGNVPRQARSPPPPAAGGYHAGGGGNQQQSAPPAQAEPVEEPPSRYLCPITMALMQDPVMSRSGINYERVSIEHWIRSENTCPSTREPMCEKDLSPNHALKEEIEEWRNRHACMWLPTGMAMERLHKYYAEQALMSMRRRKMVRLPYV